MERIALKENMGTKRAVIFLTIVAASIMIPWSHASEYAESSFGKPPAKIDTGVGQSYASRAVEGLDSDSETNDVVVGHSELGSRSPASLEFASDHAQTHARVSASHLPPASSESVQAASSKAGVQEVALIASDLGFFPKTVFVSRDVPVRIFVTGASKNTLCIMMDSFQVRKQIRSQKIEEITFTPGAPGKYRFYCPVNGMEGSLVVKELSTDIPSSELTARAE
jgi:plastocyanin